MEYKIEALNCPNCGAPLDVKPDEEVTFCQYCDSSIRISKHEETGEHSAVHSEIPKEVIEEVKNLLSSGDKVKATELYRKAADLSESEAAKQIDVFLSGITNKIILDRPLNLKGILFALLFLLILLSSMYALVSGTPMSLAVKIVFWMLLVFSALNFFSLGRSILVTIKYANKKWAKATVLKYFRISQNKKLTFFKVLLDVKEPDGNSFRTETKIMMKNPDVEKLQEGKIIEVKYLPDSKNNVVASIANLMKSN
jgi:uncharacterized Zn finger protein (UPF0148 family)